MAYLLLRLILSTLLNDGAATRTPRYAAVCKKNGWAKIHAQEFESIIKDIKANNSVMLSQYGNGDCITSLGAANIAAGVYFAQLHYRYQGNGQNTEHATADFSALILKSAKTFPYAKISYYQPIEFLNGSGNASRVKAGDGYTVYAQTAAAQQITALLNGDSLFALIKKHELIFEMCGNYIAVYKSGFTPDLEKFVNALKPLLFEAENLNFGATPHAKENNLERIEKPKTEKPVISETAPINGDLESIANSIINDIIK